MIKVLLGATAVLLAGAATAAGPVLRTRPARAPRSSSRAARTPRSSSRVAPAPAREAAEGTSSTPGVFTLPRLGSVGFRCGRRWEVQPVFDMRSALATDEVTIRAGAVTRHNFTRKVVGRLHGRPLVEEQVSRALELALPFGRYGR